VNSLSLGETPVFTVADFVAATNQTLEYALSGAVVQGEIANFRVSKGKWLYFDLKDELASVRCFASLFQLGGSFEDGMVVRARVLPKLHEQYGFSLTVQSMQPVGEGSLRRAADLLRAKLEAEGLFSTERKRMLPYPPQRIGLVASGESAAYSDFIKVLQARWGGITVMLHDTLVQGDAAPAELVRAITAASQGDYDVVVMTRGGGSADDLAAFNDEAVVRAVAASRVPTLVAIGHERDESLAELAADVRASTPSNAAELLVPDRSDHLRALAAYHAQLSELLARQVNDKLSHLKGQREALLSTIKVLFSHHQASQSLRRQLLVALKPLTALERGFALLRDSEGKVVRSISMIQVGQTFTVELVDGTIDVVAQKMYSKDKKEQK